MYKIVEFIWLSTAHEWIITESLKVYKYWTHRKPATTCSIH